MLVVYKSFQTKIIVCERFLHLFVPLLQDIVDLVVVAILTALSRVTLQLGDVDHVMGNGGLVVGELVDLFQIDVKGVLVGVDHIEELV